MGRTGRRQICILSGFLGSGKTTLLARYLRERSGSNVAIVINEYGAVGVDHHVVRMVEERTIVLEGGCACCSRREDLAAALRELIDTKESDERSAVREVLIETSGLADPVPILFTLMTDPVLRHQFAASSVVVTLDALNAAAQIDRYPEVRKQIIAADRVIITKADLVERRQIADCRMRVREVNPTAKILVSSLGDAFDALAPSGDPAPAHGLAMAQGNGVALSAGPHHGVQSGALTFNAPLDWPSFSVWLSMLLQAHGPNVLRIKGLLDIDDQGPVVLNVAQHVVYPPEHLPAWPRAECRSYLSVIARGIDPGRLARSMEAFQRAGGRTDLCVRVIR